LLGTLIILALLSTAVDADRFSLQKDLLPFGVPSEFADSRLPILDREELLACINTFVSLERRRLQLGVDRASLAIEESQGLVNTRRAPSPPEDELDRRLDEIQATVADDTDLRKKIRDFLKLRTDFFEQYSAFAKDCGSKAYRSSDVRLLFPGGLPN
jgi:hypothetical protein